MEKEEKKKEGTSPLRSRKDYGECLKKVASYLTPKEINALYEEAGIDIPEELKGKVVDTAPSTQDYDDLPPRIIPVEEIPSTPPPPMDYDDPGVSELVVLPPHGGPMPEEIPLEGPLPPTRGNLLCPGCSTIAPFGLGAGGGRRNRRLRCLKCGCRVETSNLMMSPLGFYCTPEDKIASFVEKLADDFPGLSQQFMTWKKKVQDPFTGKEKTEEVKPQERQRKEPEGELLTNFLGTEIKDLKNFNVSDHQRKVRLVQNVASNLIRQNLIKPDQKQLVQPLIEALTAYGNKLKSRQKLKPNEAEQMRSLILRWSKGIGDKFDELTRLMLNDEDYRELKKIADQITNVKTAEEESSFISRVASVLAYLLS